MSSDPFFELMSQLDVVIARRGSESEDGSRRPELEIWERLQAAISQSPMNLNEPDRALDWLANGFGIERWAFYRQTSAGLRVIAASDAEAREALFELELSRVLESQASLERRDEPGVLVLALANEARVKAAPERRERKASPRLRGVLAARRPQPFSRVERAALEFLAVLALDRAELAGELELAAQDSGSGLANRAALSRALETMQERFQNDRRPAGLVILGLQRLEGEGPRASSAESAFSLLGRGLGAALRETDRLYRYSPRGLAALLPETDAVGAEVVARRLLARSREVLLQGSRELWRIAAGFAVCPQHCAAPSSLLRSADRALGAAWSRSAELLSAAPDEVDLASKQDRSPFDELASLLSGQFVKDHEHLTELARARAELCQGPLIEAARRVLAAYREQLRFDSLALIDLREGPAVLVHESAEGAELRSASELQRLLTRLPLYEPARCVTFADLERRSVDSFSRFNLRSLLLTPIRFGPQLVGGLLAEAHGLTSEAGEAILPLLASLAEPFGCALEMDRLRQALARASSSRGDK